MKKERTVKQGEATVTHDQPCEPRKPYHRHGRVWGAKRLLVKPVDQSFSARLNRAVQGSNFNFTVASICQLEHPRTKMHISLLLLHSSLLFSCTASTDDPRMHSVVVWCFHARAHPFPEATNVYPTFLPFLRTSSDVT